MRLLPVLAFALLAAGCGQGLTWEGDASGGGTDDAGAPVVDLQWPAGSDLAGRDLWHSNPDLAAPPHVTTSVQVYVEPNDGLQPVLDAIKGAHGTLHIEMYLLTDHTVISALGSARSRGVDVKVILDHNPMGGGLSNDGAYSQLKSSGVAVAWSNPGFTFTHAKSMVIDGKTLWAMTMNLSSSAVQGNREYLCVDTDPGDVAEAEAVFQADWGGAHSAASRLVVSPDNSATRLTTLINGATKEIDIEWEEFSDNSIGSAVQQRIKAGVKVRIVVPSEIKTENPPPATLGLMTALQNGGAQVRTLDTPTVHAKLILVDRTHGFIGSENGTSNSLHSNRELGVMWENGTVAGRVGTAFDGDFANGSPL